MTPEDAADLVAAQLAELGIRAELVSSSHRKIRFRVDRSQIEVPIGPGVWAALPGLPAFVDKVPVQYDQL